MYQQDYSSEAKKKEKGRFVLRKWQRKMYQQDYSSEAETDQAKPMWIAIMEIQWMLAKNDILKKAVLLWTLSESFDRLLLENLRARTKFNEIVDIFPIKLSKGTFKNMLTRTSLGI